MLLSFYAQTAAALCGDVPTAAELNAVLAGYEVIDVSSPESGLTLRVLGGAGFAGHAIVSMQPTPWPDHMGNPDTEPQLFMQWSMGLFGAGAWPGALERALRVCRDPDTAAAARAHEAYLKIQIMADEEAPSASPGFHPDFIFLFKIAARLLQLPGTTFFNPNSEILLHSLPQEDSPAFPLEALHSRRFSGIREGWLLADSLGNGQLGLPDLEVVCRRDDFSDVEIKEWMATTTRDILPGLELKDGVKIPSPKGDLWALKCLEKGFHDTPPRPVIRLTQPSAKLPAIWQSGVYRRSWWRFWQT